MGWERRREAAHSLLFPLCLLDVGIDQVDTILEYLPDAEGREAGSQPARGLSAKEKCRS